MTIFIKISKTFTTEIENDIFEIKINDNFLFTVFESQYYLGEIDKLSQLKNGFGYQKIDGLENQKFKYFGLFNDNKLHSSGLLLTPSYIYLGEFTNNKKNGSCLIIFYDNFQIEEIYLGEISFNELNGHGKYLFNKNPKVVGYLGGFQENSFRGKGNILYSNLDEFIGEIEHYYSEYSSNTHYSQGKYTTLKNQFILFENSNHTDNIDIKYFY